jgi:hypothetical protein
MKSHAVVTSIAKATAINESYGIESRLGESKPIRCLTEDYATDIVDIIKLLLSFFHLGKLVEVSILFFLHAPCSMLHAPCSMLHAISKFNIFDLMLTQALYPG